MGLKDIIPIVALLHGSYGSDGIVVIDDQYDLVASVYDFRA